MGYLRGCISRQVAHKNLAHVTHIFGECYVLAVWRPRRLTFVHPCGRQRRKAVFLKIYAVLSDYQEAGAEPCYGKTDEQTAKQYRFAEPRFPARGSRNGEIAYSALHEAKIAPEV
jgi:hypothetical protein